jgi:HK97 gp10 family phage protein
VNVKWHGLQELRRDLETLAPDMARAAQPLVTTAAEQAAVQMRAHAPYETGRLRSSVIVQRDAQGPTTASMRVTVRARYARYLEYGTRYMPARPAFLPILNASRRAMLKDIGEDVLPAFNFRPRGTPE